jgi:hypothetical protein
MKDLTVEVLNIDELIPYCRNSREHSEEQVAQIAASIQEFGFVNPVLIDDFGTIIAGHGRVLAARKLKIKDVPCIRLGHLSETQKRAYVIVDNQLGLNATWNWDMLAVEVEELMEKGYGGNCLGFSDEQLMELIGTPNPPPEPDEEKESQPKEKVICPKCHHSFDP